MHLPRPLLCAAALLFPVVSPLHADDKPAAAPAPKEAANTEPRWSIRVEALIVMMPPEKALALLPDLRDETKIDAARTQILEAIKNDEATLTGDLFVQTVEGTRALAETSLEKIYPTRFGSPLSARKARHPQPPAVADAAAEGLTPVAFEKRNGGPSLQVQNCRVLADRQWVELSVEVKDTVLLTFDAFDAGRSPDGQPLQLKQPLFQAVKDESEAMVLRHGQPVLFGVHQLSQKNSPVEIVILQANIVPLH